MTQFKHHEVPVLAKARSRYRKSRNFQNRDCNCHREGQVCATAPLSQISGLYTKAEKEMMV
jgi:hypothetical protein